MKTLLRRCLTGVYRFLILFLNKSLKVNYGYKKTQNDISYEIGCKWE